MLNTAQRLDWLTTKTLFPYRCLVPAGLEEQERIIGVCGKTQTQGEFSPALG